MSPAEACPNWRWIAVKDDRHRDEPCPAIPGWKSRHLFSPAPIGGSHESSSGVARADSLAENLPPGLRPFCLYEHPDAGADLAQLPSDPTLGLAAIGRDCVAVRPAGSDLARQYSPQLQEQFRIQTGKPRALPAGEPVRLAVVDTGPTDAEEPETGPWNSPHGYTLVRMARDLLCDPVAGPCPFEVTARLALAYLVFSPWSKAASVRDDVRGGYVGAIGELAEAIRAEVVAWEDAGSGHLVLNLSVGWRKELTGIANPPGQAVHAALTDAFCRGALAVAAAGNRDWGPDEELHLGALLPAAWERLPGPSVADCTAALGPADPPQISDGAPGVYRPLLHATGAVDALGNPLPNARRKAEPRLVAFGDHGVVESHEPPEPTAVLTGSSVSTLVVSATAAAAWSQAEETQPFELMNSLYETGKGLYEKGTERPRTAALCQVTGAGDEPGCDQPELTVRRVYLCNAVGSELCRQPDLAGDGYPAGRLLDLQVGNLEGFEAAPVLDARRLRHERRFPGCAPVWVSVRERSLSSSLGVPSFPCPLWQLPGLDAQPASGPQPGTDPCPSCGFGSSSPGTLVMEIDSLFRGRLSSPTLKVGDRLYSLDLDLGTPFPPKVRVENVEYHAGEEVLLSFVVDGERSAVSSVLVGRNPGGGG